MDKWYKLYNVNHPFTDEMIAELRNGRKIQAIKLHRAKYLTSLHEAKAEIDYFVQHNNIQVIQKVDKPMNQPITDAMKCLIKNEFTDDAVSLYIQAYCVSYEQAKDAIEDFIFTPQSMDDTFDVLNKFFIAFRHSMNPTLEKKVLKALEFLANVINR